MMKLSQVGRDHLDALLAKIKAERDLILFLIGDFADFKVLRSKRGDQWAMLLPDVSGGDNWRIQRFDARGFFGHSVFASKAVALDEAVREGFIYSDDNALTRLEKTKSFQIGNDRLELKSNFEIGLISWETFCKRLNLLAAEEIL